MQEFFITPPDGEDHHAGYEKIPADETIEIKENKQSRVLCEVVLEGCLELTGHLVID